MRYDGRPRIWSIFYGHQRRRNGATAAISPNQRCHSRAGDASTMCDEARSLRRPRTRRRTRPRSRTLRHGDRVHIRNRVARKASSAIAAIRIRAIGKCTSKGCQTQFSVIQI